MGATSCSSSAGCATPLRVDAVVWAATGTGRPATVEKAAAMHKTIFDTEAMTGPP